MFCSLLPLGSLTAADPAGKPEDVGLSSERLKRVGELVQRHIAVGNFSGAVTLVARNGRVAQQRGVRADGSGSQEADGQRGHLSAPAQ